MKVKTPQVAWHGREENGGTNDPILSLDFHPTLTLATAGADNCIRIWHPKPDVMTLFDEVEQGSASAAHATARAPLKAGRLRPIDVTLNGSTNTTMALYNFAFSLNGHDRPVNVVRFSPNGECLASAGDDGRVVLWRQRTDHTQPNGNKWSWGLASHEREIMYKVFRGHVDDVYDLQWSPQGRFLISGSVDNTAIIWDVRTAKSMQVIREHSGFVQGKFQYTYCYEHFSVDD